MASSSSPGRTFVPGWTRRCRASAVALLLATTGLAVQARAQSQGQGFAVERFYPSAPGGGWLVMDALDLRGGLGGAFEIESGYAHHPLRVSQGSQHLNVVSAEVFADIGLALTYGRWRLYLNLAAPLVIQGESGTLGNYRFTAPTVSVARDNPDTLSDPRVGFDARLMGEAASRFRLGASAQLFAPVGATPSVDGSTLPRLGYYDTDGTFRAMLRVLVAGDLGAFAYAAHLGVHVRPLDDSPQPDGPRGSELLFGLAGGAKLTVGRGMAFAVGPEVFGETAFRSLFGSSTTGVEGLLGARLEGTGDDGPQLRVKVGAGGGLDAQFGAPEWRVVFGIEVFNHSGAPPVGKP